MPAQAKFVIKRNKKGQYSFAPHAKNGEIILAASKTYPTLEACKTGIESVRKNAADPTKFVKREMKSKDPAAAPQTYFRLIAGNGEIIGKSEMYKSPSGRVGGIKSVMNNAPGAIVEDTTQTM